MKKQVTFSQAVEGFFLTANARRLSPNTISDYQFIIKKDREYLGDDEIYLNEITSNDIENFLAAQTVAKKTLLNYHIGLSALWIWAA